MMENSARELVDCKKLKPVVLEKKHGQQFLSCMKITHKGLSVATAFISFTRKSYNETSTNIRYPAA